MRPRTLQEVAALTRVGPDWDLHLRGFLDAFYALSDDPASQALSIADEPDFVGDVRIDAFLGGVGEHLARRWGLPIPPWVRGPGRHLDRPMFVPDDEAMRGYLLGASPVAFRTRMIFTWADPLQRARFPYEEGTRSLPSTFPSTFPAL